MAPSRRDFLKGAAGSALLAPLALQNVPVASKPTAPVSIGRCRDYQPDAVLQTLTTMLDQLGGISKLIAGKTVAVKVNLTGDSRQQACGLPAARTFQVHPHLVLATATVLDRAGARRIRFLESIYREVPIERVFEDNGCDLHALAALKAKVEFEDTRNLGAGKRYHEVKVPWGGCLFPAYLLNHAYIDCDLYVSLAKLKNHVTAGVTLSMKNNFGITPTALYAHHEHDEHTTANRGAVLHKGAEQPADGAPRELDGNSPRRQTYRVPRCTVDDVGIRPIDLAIIDGIETVSGGEGPWVALTSQKPGVLLAGRNPVCTDAIATALMGYDPMAKSATGPFPGDNHLAIAAEVGLGTNDPREIEVRGVPLREALHPFRWEPAKRNT